ncbi:isocitrate lyase/phosphoenolpyruvate mutase family protein [Streptomyces sp. NPDC058953]|uniref:isocitrate lyase/PEP mutase family protein n=1 Tax=unclassified Streptomyces TaxID=2593676 RepID=UPI003685B1BC
MTPQPQPQPQPQSSAQAQAQDPSLPRLAEDFHALHTPGRPLLLANAWDALSARIAAAEGARAIATTSAGVAWTLGAPDGDLVDTGIALEAAARIVAAVPGLPVTVDIEGGYAPDAAGVGDTIRRVLAIGAVGVNIEDGTRPHDEHVRRIAAARAAADTAGVRLFVNARIDVYLAGLAAPDDRLAESLRRAAACVDAGADGVFVPGVSDPATVRELAAGVRAPLNVLVGAGAPPVAELAAAGAARISTGSSVALATYARMRDLTHELLTEGTVRGAADGYAYADVNALLRKGG